MREKTARLAQLNIELDDSAKGGGEKPAREDGEEPKQTGGKPSILKALRQFETPPPASPAKEHGDRQAVAL